MSFMWINIKHIVIYYYQRFKFKFMLKFDKIMNNCNNYIFVIYNETMLIQ